MRVHGSRHPCAACPVVSPVRDSLALGAGDTRVVLFDVATTHAQGVLAVWQPASGTVFASDVLSPTANQAPARVGSVELTAFARARGLVPRRFVGGHGVIAEWPALEAAAR